MVLNVGIFPPSYMFNAHISELRAESANLIVKTENDQNCVITRYPPYNSYVPNYKRCDSSLSNNICRIKFLIMITQQFSTKCGPVQIEPWA